MTVAADAVHRPVWRLTPASSALLGMAAVSWAGVIAYWRHMGNGVGTMGLPVIEFLAMWAVMMVAMMLPAVAPVATLYARSFRSRRAERLTLFVTGYLVTWALAGIPAYGVLRLVDDLAAGNTAAMRGIAGGVLLGAGVYQLSPLKTVCLRHCRSPLGQLLHYGNMKGRLRDLKVSLHHAGFCLGCCWALMVLFVAFGIMNVWAMVALAAVVVAEKAVRRGEVLGRAAGVVAIVLAVLVLMSPAVAQHVVPGTAGGMMMAR